jgi:hypothetical protein
VRGAALRAPGERELRELRARSCSGCARSGRQSSPHLGLELENRGTLELDLELRPRAVLLRLSKVPEQLPEGFEKLAGRSAVGTAVGGFEELRSSALRALREKVPSGAKPGAPYVRWALDPPEPKQVLLLLSWPSAR